MSDWNARRKLLGSLEKLAPRSGNRLKECYRTLAGGPVERLFW